MSIEAAPEYRLNAIYLNLANRCNLKCRHCWQSPETTDGFSGRHGGKPADRPGITLEGMRTVVSQCIPLGLESVKLTGGEPFLREDILDFVALFHEMDLAVRIETNGTRIDAATAAALKRNGVRRLSVSLDSTKPQQHDRIRGREGAFGRTIQGIRNLSDCGLDIEIIMALDRENAGEIEPMADLATALGARALKINPIMPVSRGRQMHLENQTLPAERLLDTARWVRSDLQKKSRIQIYFTLPLAFHPVSEIMRGNHHECSVLNILGIVENGDVSFCGIEYVESDLVMGNINRDRVDEIWLHHPRLSEMRASIPQKLSGICGRCICKKACLGACRACAYHNEKNLTAPYWFCREAFDKGLFPETRYFDSTTPLHPAPCNAFD